MLPSQHSNPNIRSVGGTQAVIGQLPPVHPRSQDRPRLQSLKDTPRSGFSPGLEMQTREKVKG